MQLKFKPDLKSKITFHFAEKNRNNDIFMTLLDTFSPATNLTTELRGLPQLKNSFVQLALLDQLNFAHIFNLADFEKKKTY